MSLSGSGINEENHAINGSWIAWLIDYSIGAILSVPFCPCHFVQYHFVLEPFKLIAFNALWQSSNTSVYCVVRLFIHQNNYWLEITNNTCFDKFILYRKSLQKARPLNIVQSGQNLAHKLIFLCVTRAAVWSHAFPTFCFFGHTTLHVK